MRNQPFQIRPFPCLIPFICIAAVLQAAEPSLTVSQTLSYPDSAELRATARSNLLDGFIIVDSPEALPGVSPEIKSFGFTGKPLPGFRLYGGSILASGFPSRARSPVFALYTPFYTPVSPLHGPVFRNSESADTQNAAVELSIRNTKIAALANLSPASTAPSWILLSQSVPGFEAGDTALTVSVLAATRTRAASADASDSWFLTEMPLPETRIFMPCLEILAEKGIMSGSCSGFLDLGQLIAPSGAIRAEGALTLASFSLAGGIYRAAADFEDLDGTLGSSLARFFAAPSISFPFGTDSGRVLKWGGMLVRDTVRREKFYESDAVSVSGGMGLELQTGKSRSELRLMKKETETEIAGGISLARFLHPSLRLDLRAKTVHTALTEDSKRESSVSGKLSVVPMHGSYGSLSGTAGRTTAREGMDYSISLSCGFAFKTGRQDWNLAGKITRQNTGEPLAGSLSVKLVLH